MLQLSVCPHLFKTFKQVSDAQPYALFQPEPELRKLQQDALLINDLHPNPSVKKYAPANQPRGTNIHLHILFLVGSSCLPYSTISNWKRSSLQLIAKIISKNIKMKDGNQRKFKASATISNISIWPTLLRRKIKLLIQQFRRHVISLIH